MDKSMKLDIYEAKDGWRWRLVAANGQIMADSAEAYTREHDAARAFDTLRAAFLEVDPGPPPPTTYSE